MAWYHTDEIDYDKLNVKFYKQSIGTSVKNMHGHGFIYYAYEPETQIVYEYFDVAGAIGAINLGIQVGYHDEITSKRRFGGDGYFIKEIIHNKYTESISKEEFIEVRNMVLKMLRFFKPITTQAMNQR